MSGQDKTSTFQLIASYLLVIGLLVALHTGAVFMGLTPILKGEMPDTDTYMRLVRVEELVDGGRWLDSKIERMNAPYGDTLNWTRPLDVLIIALATPFKTELGYSWHEAIYWGGAILPPILQVIFALTVVWMAAPFFSKQVRPLLALFVCAQPVVFVYSLAGRPDHQTLLLISAAAMLGFAIRVLLGQARALRAGLWAGLWAGFGIWVSTEFEFALGILTVLLALLWLWRGERRLLELLEGLALGALLMTAVGVFAERAEAWNSIRELDKISLSQFIGTAVNCGLWGLLAWLCPQGGAPRRFITLAAMGSAALGLLVVLAPELLRGPAGDIDPRVMKEFFLNIHEMRPLWPTDLDNLSYLLLCSGVPLLGLPLWGWAYRRESWLTWSPLLVFTLAFTIFSLFHARFSQFAAPFGAVLLLAAVVRISQRLEGRPLLVRALIQAGLLISPLLLAGVAIAFSPAAAKDSDAGPQCAIKPISAQLNALPSGIIMAQLNYGPELLYFTHQRTVAGPYHRNTQGILDSIDFFGETPDAKAHEILKARGISYVLVCPEADELDTSRSARLAKGLAPGWLTPLELPLEQDFRLYKVN